MFNNHNCSIAFPCSLRYTKSGYSVPAQNGVKQRRWQLLPAKRFTRIHYKQGTSSTNVLQVEYKLTLITSTPTVVMWIRKGQPSLLSMVLLVTIMITQLSSQGSRKKDSVLLHPTFLVIYLHFNWLILVPINRNICVSINDNFLSFRNEIHRWNWNIQTHNGRKGRIFEWFPAKDQRQKVPLLFDISSPKLENWVMMMMSWWLWWW